jgi:hypothetical protein
MEQSSFSALFALNLPAGVKQSSFSALFALDLPAGSN